MEERLLDDEASKPSAAAGVDALRVCTILACLLEMVSAVLSVLDPDLPRLILSIYALLFCLLIILSEIGISATRPQPQRSPRGQTWCSTTSDSSSPPAAGLYSSSCAWPL